MTERLIAVEQYLVELRAALRVSDRRRERILGEAAAHLRDVTERQMRSGSDLESAQREAVARFGPAEQVAALFNAQRRRWWMPLGRLDPAADPDLALDEESSPGGVAKVRRRWWIVALVTVVAVAGGVLYARHHQPTSYRSMSEVVYNPQRSSSSETPINSSAAGNWGRDRVDMASTAVFAQWLLASHGAPHSAAAADRLVSHFTASATPAGNGLVFTVTYADRSDARRVANELASGFPAYLQASTPNTALRRRESALKLLDLQLSDPKKYGPFLKTPAGQTVHSKTTGAPIVDRTAVALLPTDIEVAINNIAQFRAIQPSPAIATFTIVNPASRPAQVQPALAKPLAIGVLIGLIVGTLLALALPRPPQHGAPAVNLQP